MAYLHAAPGTAGVQLSSRYHAAADPGTQGDHHRGVVPLGGPRPILPDGGAVGVILQINGPVNPLLHQSPQRRVSEIHIGAVYHHARLRIHLPRNSHAHRFDLIPRGICFLRSSAAQQHQLGGNLFRRPRLLHMDRRFVPDMSAFICQSGGQIGTAYIHTQIHHCTPCSFAFSWNSWSIRSVNSSAALCPIFRLRLFMAATSTMLARFRPGFTGIVIQGI